MDNLVAGLAIFAVVMVIMVLLAKLLVPIFFVIIVGLGAVAFLVIGWNREFNHPGGRT